MKTWIIVEEFQISEHKIEIINQDGFGAYDYRLKSGGHTVESYNEYGTAKLALVGALEKLASVIMMQEIIGE